MQPKVPIDVKPITIVKRGGTQHPLDLVNRKAAYDDLTIMFKEITNGLFLNFQYVHCTLHVHVLI